MTVLILPTDAPSVPGPPQGQWTHDLWETLPDDRRRYEVIDGVLYMSTAPNQLGAAGRYDNPRIYGGGDSVRFECLPTIEFRVSDLFAGAPDTTL